MMDGRRGMVGRAERRGRGGVRALIFWHRRFTNSYKELIAADTRGCAA